WWSPASAQEVTGLQFVADNAATANPTLVATRLKNLDGSDSDHTLALPPGFSISTIATGLVNPRFMAFDDGGNLLVADWDPGKIYRYPASNGSIAPSSSPPEPLIKGLDGPSNVA